MPIHSDDFVDDRVRQAIRALPRQPFLLQPFGKDYLWGGDRLHTDFHLEGLDDVKPLAEAWVCSTHKDGESTVAVPVPVSINPMSNPVSAFAGKSADAVRGRGKAVVDWGLSTVNQTLNAASVARDSHNAYNAYNYKHSGATTFTEAVLDEGREDRDVKEVREAREAAVVVNIPLSAVLREHVDWLGTHAQQVLKQAVGVGADLQPGELPILVKLIDAAQPLSVQVHPDDEYAQRHESGQLGKTEMWYVVDAEPGASLVYGFNQPTSPDQLRKAVEVGKRGSLERLLNKVAVHQGDLFFIGAGTVHAIGKGCLIAEVQESSNLTYRLYDYNRVGKDGRLREVHVDKAIEVLKMERQDSIEKTMRVLRYKPSVARELLARCRYFQVERLLVNNCESQENSRGSSGVSEVRLEVVCNSFHTMLCLDGEIQIKAKPSSEKQYGKNSDVCDYDHSSCEKDINMQAGSCVFIPADVKVGLFGSGELLDISC